MCVCVCFCIAFMFFEHSAWCVWCVSWELSPSPSCYSLAQIGHRAIEGTNIQQISGIKVLITQQTGILRVVQSIMLNYAWPDADLVAFIMLHSQPRVSHKQKIRVSYVPWEKKEKRFVVGNDDGRCRHPLTWRRAYCVLLINAAKRADYQSKCFRRCVGYRVSVRRDEERN